MMGDGTELADSDELIRRRRALTSRPVIGREWLHVLVDNFPLINVTSADFRTHAPILKRTEKKIEIEGEKYIYPEIKRILEDIHL